MTRYTYNPAGELIREEEYASGNIDVRTRPLRTITYHRDRIGRIRQKDSHLDGGEILSTHYRYDKLNRLIQAHNAHSELRFGYDHNGLVKEQLIHLDEPLSSGISRSQSKDVAAQITEHRYDVLGNRTQTILPTGEVLNRLYYGSGHLHHINLDGATLADIERDALHRPVERTIGKLNTQFQLDPLGRLKQQIAQPNSHNKADPAVLIGRRYQYDTIGNLIRTDDQTNGSRDYTYDALGRITQSADEHYRYDPAHNLTDGSRISGNRLTQYQGTSYRYDPLGNLFEKQHNNGEIQHYRYNADNQLAEAEIHRPGQNAVLYRYRYDPIGRRIAKVHPDGSEIQYLWDGSRLLQEYRKDRTYTYVYTEDRNYEPLAQITTYNDSDNAREILYYHNDQISIPREMTDEEGNIVWSGNYSGWGKLTQESRLKLDIHQPFRLQNQYYDEETGLHYNFFRYYDPEIGRFTQQDPIRLKGGTNFYNFAASTTNSVDVLGLTNFKYHGNWCGPGWTGGHWESYSSQNDKNGYYKQPIDMMDKTCQNHDKCYAQCRETFPCNKQLRGQCMAQCDRDLGRASENTKISSQNSYANKFGLELWMNHNTFPDAGDNAVSCYDGLTHVPNRAPSANEFFNMLIR